MGTPATQMPYGDPSAMVAQAVGLFATHMKRNSLVGNMTGSMPKDEAGAIATLNAQTDNHMPVVRAVDLKQSQGDEVTFNLLNPVNAQPIMGSEWAEGHGTGMSMSQGRLRVNQARFPISAGDAMTALRSPFKYRRLARPVAQNLMDRYLDQSVLVHAAGARGFQDNDEWVVPLASDERYGSVMVNTVKAPTKNRHFLADATDGIKAFALSSSDVDLGTTDLFSLDTVDAMATLLDSMPLPPPGVIIPGDPGSEEDPIRLWLVSPAQFSAIEQSSNFRTYQANALQRAAQAKNHPIFRGQKTILFNGFLIKAMPRPIRFYADSTMQYCASASSETESTAQIADTLTKGTYAVDRSIILGGQAVAQAFGASHKSGIPFFWSEKELDHADKIETLIGSIAGTSKVRFKRKLSDGTYEYVDYGASVVDSVVKTPGGVL